MEQVKYIKEQILYHGNELVKYHNKLYEIPETDKPSWKFMHIEIDRELEHIKYYILKLERIDPMVKSSFMKQIESTEFFKCLEMINSKE